MAQGHEPTAAHSPRHGQGCRAQKAQLSPLPEGQGHLPARQPLLKQVCPVLPLMLPPAPAWLREETQEAKLSRLNPQLRSPQPSDLTVLQQGKPRTGSPNHLSSLPSPGIWVALCTGNTVSAQTWLSCQGQGTYSELVHIEAAPGGPLRGPQLWGRRRRSRENLRSYTSGLRLSCTELLQCQRLCTHVNGKNLFVFILLLFRDIQT